MRSQKEGPIVFPMALDSHDESESESEHRSRALENALSDAYKYIRLLRVFGEEKEYEPYNILKKSPDFSNDFGSTAAADENDFHLLKKVNKGIFTVKLKAVRLKASSYQYACIVGPYMMMHCTSSLT